MASRNRLTARFVKSVKHTGRGFADRYSDGNGLMLQVMPRSGPDGTSTKQWVQRITLDGKRYDYGLGGYPDIGLAEARLTAARNMAEARAYRRAVHQGKVAEVPGFEIGRRRTVARRSGRPVPVAGAAVPGHGVPFAEVWEACIVERSAGWKNPATDLRQWRYELREPLRRIAGLPVGAVTVDHLREVLAPLGPAKRDKLLRKVGTVFDFAVASGHRPDNPARILRASWRGLGRSGSGGPERHPALPWREVPAFWQRLRALGPDGGAGALALIVLSGVRSKEAYLAQWPEVSLDLEGPEGATWTVPAARMKDGRAHRVPLGTAAVEVLRAVGPGTSGPVFRGPRGRTLIDKDPRKALSDLGLNGTASVHGFRSTLRDWCSDHGVDRVLAEHILAHKVGNQVEQAYARSSMFARRAEVMEQWGRFVTGAG